MNKRELKGNAKEAFSSLEKRIIVEEIRSGMLTIRQSIQAIPGFGIHLTRLESLVL